MQVRTIVFLVILSGIMLLSCTKSGEKKEVTSNPTSSASGMNSGKASLPDTTQPAGTSALIVPDRPFADTALGVQFTAPDQGGRPVSSLFRWFVDNTLAQEDATGTLNPGIQKKGSVVYVEVIPLGGVSIRSNSVTIINKPPVITAVVMKPLPAFAGAVITAVPNGKDLDGDEVTYSFRWKVNNAFVSEEGNSNTFDTRDLHKKDVVTVIVTPSDGEISGASLEGSTTLQNATPQITSLPPSEYKEGVYTYQITATDPDGDPLTYTLLSAPPNMTIDHSTGLIRWELPKTASGNRETVVKVAADDGNGGVAFQEFPLSLEVK